MNLNLKIMLRIESEFGLLYDGNNGNTVTIPLEDAIALQDNDIEYFIRNNRQIVLKKLSNEGFISVSDKEKHAIDNSSVSTPKTDDIKKVNVLLLRSQNSPYKVLWAVTPKCNMKCLYCWPDVASIREEYSGLEIDNLKKIAQQLVAAKVCKVIISGGEALLCKHIWEIIKILRDGGCTVMMISNGTTINGEVLEKVKNNNVALGISFDSSRDEINSITRRVKIVDRISNVISAILKKGIQMAALITVTKYNFDYIKEHVDYLNSLGVKVIVLQDLKPFGSKENYNDARLTVDQEKQVPVLMKYLVEKYPNIRFDPTELTYFCNCRSNEENETIMSCDAGENGGYIDFYGNFMPCSFLSNLTYGNILEENLMDLWRDSQSANKLRELRKIRVDTLSCCKGCPEINSCDGGCRADAFLVSGDFFGASSRCPRSMGILDD